MVQAVPQQMGGPASDTILALATELVQYISAADTRYMEGIEAGEPAVGKNLRQAGLAGEVAAKIRFLIHGNAPVSASVAPSSVPHNAPFEPPPKNHK